MPHDVVILSRRPALFKTAADWRLPGVDLYLHDSPSEALARFADGHGALLVFDTSDFARTRHVVEKFLSSQGDADLLVLGGEDVVQKEIKWRGFSVFVTNEGSGYAFWSAPNLLFYGRAAGNWLMPSGLLALAAGAGAVYAVARMRHPGITTLAIFFGIGFVLATIHPLKSERYMTPLFPSLWLLTGFGAARLWDDMRARRLSRPLLALVAIAPAVVSVWSLAYWMPRLEPVWAGVTAQGLRASADQVVTWQQPGKPLLIIGTFGELGPPYFEWRFRPVQAFAASGAPIQYDAPPGDGTNYERVLNWARANPGAQITTIRVAPGSNLDQTNDMRNKNAWRQTLSADFERAPVGYRLVDRRQYPESGLTVSYFLPVAP